MTVLAGEEFTITVPFSGRPKPTPLWTVNGDEVSPDGRIKFETSENQTIYRNKSAKRATDSGSYTIQLVNTVGSDSASCKVYVVGKLNTSPSLICRKANFIDLDFSNATELTGNLTL